MFEKDQKVRIAGTPIGLTIVDIFHDWGGTKYYAMYDHNGEVAEFAENELRPTLRDEAIEFFKWIFAGDDAVKKISISTIFGFIAGIAITLLIK